MTTNSGLLLVDKASGLTSHDVVAQVRKILNERRVGHAGTLDPMATGLLVLAVGPSTRLLRFAQSEVKHYSGTVQLGVATDSLDADGTPVEQHPVPALGHDEMDAAASAMLGVQQQTPPMVSAVKVGGRRLHQLARQGVEVEREARDVTIHSFDLTATDDPSVWSFDVECSVGTYVRVLLSDLAVAVGTVGHLSSLRRTKSGDFLVRDALSVEQLRDVVASGTFALRAPSAFVERLEHVVLDEGTERRIRMGQRVTFADPIVTDEIAALKDNGQLVAILRRRGEGWQPEVVLPEGSPERRVG
jgi:tRNA pseudouridine55 synthase